MHDDFLVAKDSNKEDALQSKLRTKSKDFGVMTAGAVGIFAACFSPLVGQPVIGLFIGLGTVVAVGAYWIFIE